MTAKELARLEAQAAMHEEEARKIRSAISVFQALLQTDAEQRFPKTLEKATKLDRARPKPKRGSLVNAVKDALKTGPRTTQELLEALREDFGTVDPARFYDMHTRGHLVTKGNRKTRIYALPRTKIKPPVSAATNGHAPQIYPFSLPKTERKHEKKSAVSTAIWQLVKNANEPVSAASIVASAKAAGVKVRGQAIGASVRYGFLKQAPGSTKTRKLFVLGTDVPELATKTGV